MTSETRATVARLAKLFPDVASGIVVAVVVSSAVVVSDAIGYPASDKVEELARLRLEVRTGHPAKHAAA